MCECNQGYEGNGKAITSKMTGEVISFGTPKGCIDVDECKFALDDCLYGQFCYNTIGKVLI